MPPSQPGALHGAIECARSAYRARCHAMGAHRRMAAAAYPISSSGPRPVVSWHAAPDEFKLFEHRALLAATQRRLATRGLSLRQVRAARTPYRTLPSPPTSLTCRRHLRPKSKE